MPSDSTIKTVLKCIFVFCIMCVRLFLVLIPLVKWPMLNHWKGCKCGQSINPIGAKIFLIFGMWIQMPRGTNVDNKTREANDRISASTIDILKLRSTIVQWINYYEFQPVSSWNRQIIQYLNINLYVQTKKKQQRWQKKNAYNKNKNTQTESEIIMELVPEARVCS